MLSFEEISRDNIMIKPKYYEIFFSVDIVISYIYLYTLELNVHCAYSFDLNILSHYHNRKDFVNFESLRTSVRLLRLSKAGVLLNEI